MVVAGCAARTLSTFHLHIPSSHMSVVHWPWFAHRHWLWCWSDASVCFIDIARGAAVAECVGLHILLLHTLCIKNALKYTISKPKNSKFSKEGLNPSPHLLFNMPNIKMTSLAWVHPAAESWLCLWFISYLLAYSCYLRRATVAVVKTVIVLCPMTNFDSWVLFVKSTEEWTVIHVNLCIS